MFPMGLVTGNTYVMKPSEQDPGPCMLLVQLLQEAGLPDGVLNVIHGQKGAVDAICDSPYVKAVSFVGGDRVGKYIYERGSSTGKRVQSNMVSPPHLIVHICILMCTCVCAGCQVPWCDHA